MNIKNIYPIDIDPKDIIFISLSDTFHDHPPNGMLIPPGIPSSSAR